jgi:ATP-binding cassette subfamily C protein
VADNHEPIRVRPPRSAGPSALTARGLTFRYRPDSRAILSDVDLDVAAGELVALVGPSGAGKSTFANLCAGMLAPTSGFVGAGRRLVLLPQHPYIVAGTYRENLSYLAPAQLADDPAWSAVDAVELTDLIIHAGGLDADVADLGRGDAQRLVLARAWLSGAEVLVIDEGWSLLDADARHRIENRFRMAGRTLVVVSHHLDIAPRADRVLYFDGNDVTTGRHDELLQRSASYRELVAFAAGA